MYGWSTFALGAAFLMYALLTPLEQTLNTLLSSIFWATQHWIEIPL